ncbi:MAG: PIN domain-containing protein, partial [Anaerolineales bacterium]|nr:PIN domain-containing protein [Anaerolineales bacterium]
SGLICYNYVVMKIYLDVCCLNRPFDDQKQQRVRLESEAILLIMTRFESNQWQWFSSEVVLDEILQTGNEDRKKRLLNLNEKAAKSLIVTDKDFERGQKLAALGFGDMDALHLACAESGDVDVFLTTDDKLIRTAKKLAGQLNVLVDNPLNWLFAQRMDA